MCRTVEGLIACVLALATGVAWAADPPVNGTTGSAPTPAQQAPQMPMAPVEVPPAERGLSTKAKRLNEIESDLSLALAGLKLDNAQAQRNDLTQKLTGVRQGTNQLPELVGISGVGGVYRAQFLSGQALVDVGVGDWVSSDWKIARLTSAAVELVRRDSKARHQVLFGQRPVSSKEIAAEIAAAVGPAQPSYPNAEVIETTGSN